MSMMVSIVPTGSLEKAIGTEEYPRYPQHDIAHYSKHNIMIALYMIGLYYLLINTTASSTAVSIPKVVVAFITL